jgi:hypothetical protein
MKERQARIIRDEVDFCALVAWNVDYILAHAGGRLAGRRESAEDRAGAPTCTWDAENAVRGTLCRNRAISLSAGFAS